MLQLVSEFAGSKKRKPLAETTVAHHHAMLKTAYNWALEEELLSRSQAGAARPLRDNVVSLAGRRR